MENRQKKVSTIQEITLIGRRDFNQPWDFVLYVQIVLILTC